MNMPFHRWSRCKTKRRNSFHIKDLRRFGNYSNSIVPGGLPVQS